MGSQNDQSGITGTGRPAHRSAEHARRANDGRGYCRDFQRLRRQTYLVVRAVTIVRAVLAFTILAGHGWSYVRYLLVVY